MKIKINAEDHLPLEKTVNMDNVLMLVIPVINDNNKNCF